MSKMIPESPAEEKTDTVPEKYEIEDAANTLTKAEEIKRDKRLMPHVHKHMKKKMKAMIRSTDDLRALAKKMNMPEDDEA